MFVVVAIITIDKHGDFGLAFNTLEAVWARKKNNTLQSGMNLKMAKLKLFIENAI